MTDFHLIFDFDGVLGNTRDASGKSTALVNNVSEETGRAENIRYASNKPNHTKNNSLSEADFERIAAWTLAFGKNMLELGFPMFSDFVREIELLETPYKAVVSSGSAQYILPALEKTAIKPTHVLTYEDHHAKEDKIEHICRDWGIPVSEAYYFTDTLADVYELRDCVAKDKLIGVAWGYCGKEALQTVLEVEYILDVPSDIHRVLIN